MFDIHAIRDQFPITRRLLPVFGLAEPQPLIFLDHGASTHPPRPVIDELTHFLENSYANVHRAEHALSQLSTDMFEQVYRDIFAFVHADESGNGVVLASNTTGALDLAAHLMSGFDGATLVTWMEHHSNDLPHRKRGEVFRAEILADGTLDYADVERNLRQHKIKLLAVTGASNVTGFLTDLPRLARLAHANGARILVDAAQLLAHRAIDVRPNDDPEHIDFLAAAGHKAYAPLGSAFLLGPADILDQAPPYIPGGGTVKLVTPRYVLYEGSPDRHQGGTPNIAGAVALGAALRFLRSVGMDAIREHEEELTAMAVEGFRRLDGVHLLGNPDPALRLGVTAFTVDGASHALVATVLDNEAAIATRNGCFCAHPYIARLLNIPDSETDDSRDRILRGEEWDMPGAVRATYGIYNTAQEVERLLEAVEMVRDHAWKGDYSHVTTIASQGMYHTVDS